ncbi:MAG: DUF1848 domain-containing protein [Phycisphaerales bacterium]|jgi:hypothetical protein
MKKIISISRRTDIPAFYGDWFMNRLKEGFVGLVNPFSGKKYIVPLKPEDVTCFVFWSKDFSPFIENLKILDRLGYKFYFNYTVTGLPEVFENDVNKQSAIDALKQLGKMYSPRHINWRFDPIILTDTHDRNFYIDAFEKLASEFAGCVERCYFSFVNLYNKVIRNFEELEKATGLKISNCSDNFKAELANDLANIAKSYGIRMFSCCGDYLVSDNISKAHCIDGDIIESLFFPEGLRHKPKPTRKECGCAESTDIGTYDTCPHGCVYCYANMNKQKACKAFNNHDKDSAFLGYSKSQSDKWLMEIQYDKDRKDCRQLKIF